MKKRLTNNIGLKVMAVLFAIFLWIMVVNIDDPVSDVSYRNIPVVVQHDEIITNQGKTYQIVNETNVVTVTVRAKQTILNKIKIEDIVAYCDMREMQLNSIVPIKVMINGFEGKYESAVTNPLNLQIKLDNSESKDFPISASTVGSLRDGYVLGKAVADPDTITISGPQSTVGRISRVVAKANVAGMSSNDAVEAELIFYDSADNVIDQSLLTTNLGDGGIVVNVEIHKTKDVPLEFDPSAIVPGEGFVYSSITYEPTEVTISGEKLVLDSVDRIQIPAEALAVEGVAEKTKVLVDITDYLPEGIELVDESANSVAVTIMVEKAGTKSVNVPLGSIEVKNTQSGLKLSYDGLDDLELRFVGTEEVLKELTADKLTVSIDLKEFKAAGEYEVPVKVTMPVGCELVETATIKVKLTE